MSKGWKFKDGDWNILCSVCSKKIKGSEARKRWDGLYVCMEDYEQRHPQDLLKVKQERMTVPFTRPDPEDIFVDVTYEDT